MVIRRFVPVLMSFILSFSLTGSLASADVIEEQVIFEAEEITNLSLLYERARKGITDADIIDRSIGILKNRVSNVEGVGTVEQLETTQKLRAVKKGDKIIESYKVVTLTIVSDEDEDEGIVAPLAEGSKSESRWDTAGGVRAYSTVNYDRSIDGNLYLYKLTSVSGGWERHDSSYVLSDRKVNYGATGTTKEGGFANQSSGFLYPTSDTYSYTAPSNWVPVWQSYMIFGTNSWVTIKRGTSSEWELHLSNLVA